MANDCSGCTLKVKIESIDETTKDQEQRIMQLERRADVSDERHVNIIEKITDLSKTVKDGNQKIFDEVTSIKERPDQFKEFLTNFGLKLLEIAVLGGVLYAAAQKIL